MTLNEIGGQARAVSRILNSLGSREKNIGLEEAARALLEGEDEILAANEADYEMARQKGMSQGLLDRLRLTPARVQSMADGLLKVASLEDPVGEVISMKLRPNGLKIGQKRVPLGVIGMIYEARPNVTADAFGLCFKSGNAVILKGGSDAGESNKAIVRWIRTGLVRAGLPEDAVQLIEDASRETTRELMRLNQYVDVLIPRGGAGLIRTVVENSTVPVIQTGTGNCHIFVDESADFHMALDIIFNAKTQRIGVCNACESLVVHRKIAADFLPLLRKKLEEKQVEIRADEAARAIEPSFKPAEPEDWGTEYLDYILSLKLVDSLDEAIRHINTYNTGHSEAIITSDYFNAQKFLDEVDAAAVYVNASTRFTDGEEFGFGAEIGISTQKLHARGPMGLKELTTTKYIIYGDGQIRKKEEEEPFDLKKEIISWIQIIAAAVIIALVLNNFIIANSRVPSGSMENTIMTKSRVIGSRLSYLTDDPERGDIVIFHYPDDESVYYVKRVIGLPGETVEIVDGKVYINGSDTPLEEPYLPEPMEGSYGPYTVPEGSYFMLGDNRNNSRDARYWENKFVKKEKIIAKVLFCYYPLSQFGPVE